MYHKAYHDFLTLKRSGNGDEKLAVVASDVYAAIKAEAEKNAERWAKTTVFQPVAPTLRCADIEVIPHEKLPDGMMILVPEGLHPEVAVAIYLDQLKAKEKENDRNLP